MRKLLVGVFTGFVFFTYSTVVLGETSQSSQVPTYSSLQPLQWSTDGSKCLVRPASDRIEIYNSQGNLIWSKTSASTEVSFSPDGNSIVRAVPSDGVFVSFLQNQQETKIYNTQGTNKTVSQICWSPNGQKISFWVFGPASGNNSYSTGELMFVDPSGTNLDVVTTVNTMASFLSQNVTFPPWVDDFESAPRKDSQLGDGEYPRKE